MTCWAILKVSFHLWKNSVKTFAIKNAIKIKPAISTRSDDNFWSSLSEKKKAELTYFLDFLGCTKVCIKQKIEGNFLVQDYFSISIHNLGRKGHPQNTMYSNLNYNRYSWIPLPSAFSWLKFWLILTNICFSLC